MNKVYHVNWLICALDKYKKENRTVEGDMSIETFIEENCSEELSESIMY